ncbi:hypothetical protein BD310DRAFT_942373, partial [Dichomitus squalens]
MPRSNEADRAVQAASVASLLTCGTSSGTPCSSSSLFPSAPSLASSLCVPTPFRVLRDSM